jgi:hypothetical protein
MGFAVPLQDTATTGIVRCDRPWALDLEARRAHRIEAAPAAVIDEALAGLAALVESAEPLGAPALTDVEIV